MDTNPTVLRDADNGVGDTKTAGAPVQVQTTGAPRVLDPASAVNKFQVALGVDLACAWAANTLACLAFAMVFDGYAFMIGACAGVTFGVVGAAVARWRNLAWWVGVSIAAALFLMLGPAAALWSTTVAGIPTADSLTGLYDGAIRGWWRLLTLVPPVGEYRNLYVIPMLSGTIGAVTSLSVARSRRLGIGAVVVPLAVLGLAIAVGTHDPFALLLTGSSVGAVCSIWAVNIDRRRRPLLGGNTKFRGLTGASVVLAISLVVGSTIGGEMPGLARDDRLVLRDDTLPPFDPSQYPSPLVGYRRFVLPEVVKGKEGSTATVRGSLKGKDLFTVDGLTSPARIRIATMDAYDGNVFRFASGDRASAFRPVGNKIGASAPNSVTVKIGIVELQGVWLPLIGQPSRIRFEGPNEVALASTLRYNDRQRAAVTMRPSARGDRYFVETTIAADPGDAQLCRATASTVNLPLEPGIAERLVQVWRSKLPDAVDKKLGPEKAVRGGCSQSMSMVLSAQQQVQRAFFDDGDGGPKNADKKAASGHYFARLDYYLAKMPFGNEEQAAAAMAALLRAQGLDARVALGAIHEGSGSATYKGRDITAWVDVRTEQYGWVPFDVTPAVKATPPDLSAPTPIGPAPLVTPPPPVVPPRTRTASDDGILDGSSTARLARNPRVAPTDSLAWLWTALRYVGIPLFILLTPLLAVLVFKRRRRNKRRRNPDAATNIAGGWLEMVDLLRDAGKPVPSFATRREIANLSGLDEVPMVATEVDAALFGAREPDSAQSDAVWAHVDAQRGSVLKSMSRRDRIRTALSLASLRSDVARDRQAV